MALLDKLIAGFADALEEADLIKEGGSVFLGRDDLQQRALREGLPYWGSIDVTVMWTGVDQPLGVMPSQSILKGIMVRSISGFANKDVKVKTFGPNLLVNGAVVAGQPDQASGAIFGPRGYSAVVDELMSKDRKNNWLTLASVLDQDPRLIVATVTGSGNGTFSTNKNGGLSGNNTNIGNGTFSYVINVLNTGVVSTGIITLVDVLPVDAIYVSSSGSGWSVSVTNGVLTATTTDIIAATTGTKALTVILRPKSPVNIVYNVYGAQIDVDYASTARPMHIYGTSIPFGTSAGQYRTHYLTRFRNWLRDVKGLNVRMVNKAISGANTIQLEDLRANDNWCELAEIPPIVIYDAFHNDTTQNIDTAITVSNMMAYINHWIRASSSILILIVAPTPNATTVVEARNVTLNTLLKSTIEALSNPKIRYIEEVRTAWNPVTESGAYTSDGLHPNDAGNLRVYNAIVSHFTTNNLTVS